MVCPTEFRRHRGVADLDERLLVTAKLVALTIETPAATVGVRGGTVKETPESTSGPPPYPNVTPRNSISPRTGGAAEAPGASTIAGVRASTARILSPHATPFAMRLACDAIDLSGLCTLRR